MIQHAHPRIDVLLYASFLSICSAVLVSTASVTLDLWTPDNPGVGVLMTVALGVPTALWLVAALVDTLSCIEWLSAHSGARLVRIAVAGAQILIGAFHALGAAMLASVVLSVFALLLR